MKLCFSHCEFDAFDKGKKHTKKQFGIRAKSETCAASDADKKTTTG
jgi:hypothetical protein